MSAKNVIKLLSSSIMVQAINLLTQPVITRLYSPADYGTLSLISSIISIGGIIGFFSYERAILIVKDNSSAFSLAKSLITFAIYIMILLVFGLGASSLFINIPFHYSILLISIVLFGVTLIDTVLTNLNYKMGNYGSVAKRRVIVAVFSSLIQIVLGFLKFGAKGLLISNVVCFSLGVYLIAKNYITKILQVKRATKSLFSQYRRLAIIETPQNLINVFSMQFPVYCISHYYGVATTGQYGLAVKLISVPALIITSSFSNVFTQNFAKMYHEKQNFYEYTIKIWQKQILLGMIPTVIIILAGPAIFTFIFGAKWYLAGQIARIVCVSTWVSILSGTTLFAFMIMNKGKIMFVYSILLLVTRAIGMYILTYDLWSGLIFYVASEVIIRLIWLYLLRSTMLKEYKSYYSKVIA